MSEGQPALTPEDWRKLAEELLTPEQVAECEHEGLRMAYDILGRAFEGLRAELAREREARQEAERVLADAKRFHGNEFKDRQVAEGRVRELQEALERIDKAGAEVEPGWAADVAREALVGLPE